MLILVCSPLGSFSIVPFFFWLDGSSDYAKLLEQLLSKEVDDVSTQQPQSVEELRKVIEQKDKVIEDQQKENQALRKEKDTQIEQLRKEIEELKQALLLASSQK